MLINMLLRLSISSATKDIFKYSRLIIKLKFNDTKKNAAGAIQRSIDTSQTKSGALGQCTTLI